MPALKPTSFTAEIIWLGCVPVEGEDARSVALNEAFAGFDGIEGERHGGLTRAACGRTTSQYKRGTEIRNARQFSILSVEDLDVIAENMGVAGLDPIWLGASMVVKGIPDFSHIPPSSRLQTQDGTSLTVDMENRPCNIPAREIEKDLPGLGQFFKGSASGVRGITAWVECEGMLRVGDVLTLHVPDQPVWLHLDEARG